MSLERFSPEYLKQLDEHVNDIIDASVEKERIKDFAVEDVGARLFFILSFNMMRSGVSFRELITHVEGAASWIDKFNREKAN